MMKLKVYASFPFFRTCSAESWSSQRLLERTNALMFIGNVATELRELRTVQMLQNIATKPKLCFGRKVLAYFAILLGVDDDALLSVRQFC